MINVILLLILRNGCCGLELFFASCCASVGRPCCSKLRSSVQEQRDDRSCQIRGGTERSSEVALFGIVLWELRVGRLGRTPQKIGKRRELGN